MSASVEGSSEKMDAGSDV